MALTQRREFFQDVQGAALDSDVFALSILLGFLCARLQFPHSEFEIHARFPQTVDFCAFSALQRTPFIELTAQIDDGPLSLRVFGLQFNMR